METTPPPDQSQRLLSLDAYRGLIMLLMASGGLGVVQMAAANPGSFWEFIRPQFEHKAWQGCSLWDLIQPGFMFMVGVAVPWSCAKRRASGQGFLGMTWHALTRSVALVVLAIVLTTREGDKHTVFLFTNVLAQIGLGYLFLFLISRMGWEYMVSSVIVILVGYAWVFIEHPLPSGEGLAAIAGMKGVEGAALPGFAGHWSIHTNAAAEFDRWFLNLLPQSSPFQYSSGGYQTLNFVPSLATMLIGAITGDYLLRSKDSHPRKCARMLVAGMLLILVGVGLDLTEVPVIGGSLAHLTVLPVVKRIWTPSWVLLSGGWVLLILATFYWLVEIAGRRRLVFPLVVVGMNSITIYVLDILCARWIRDQLHKHLPECVFVPGWVPVIERLGILMVLWLLCYWLYRQKAFLKL